jgi:hypothetical protein
MKKYVSIFFCCIIFASLKTFAVDHYDSIELDFIGSPYPSTPVSLVRQLAMNLWGDFHAARYSLEMKLVCERKIDMYVDKALQLYKYACDVTSCNNADENTGVIEYANEITALIKLISSTEFEFDNAMVGHKSDQASSIKILLQKIQKKLEQAL